ncbi:hypothetical protein AAIB46_10090 [Streptomyces sp. 35M1]|uniref:hypothetical protein n=1 Tax=Streptomyces sp. 35M1 TaxID=3142978 RepID=UPI00399046EB
MSTDLGAYVAAAAVAAVAVITLVARLAPSARSSEPVPETAKFSEPEAGVRYLQCDELRCGHMTYPHRPRPGGTWVCANCGTVKGGTS